MKLKLFTILIVTITAFTLGSIFGKYKEIEHRSKIKRPVMTAHSSVLREARSIAQNVVVKLVKEGVK